MEQGIAQGLTKCSKKEGKEEMEEGKGINKESNLNSVHPTLMYLQILW